MKKLITFFSLIIWIDFVSAEQSEEAEASLNYEAFIAYKVSADLADTYSRCSNLYTAIYGYLSNNPTSSWSKFTPRDFIQAAKTYTLLALEIQKNINWSGDSNPDRGLTRTLAYKELVSKAEDDVSIKRIIYSEIEVCRSVLEKNKED
tara:strand:- start:1719 stop:2162 length:444 start_codon:yes stop_codon:yes gene_type:complete